MAHTNYDTQNNQITAGGAVLTGSVLVGNYGGRVSFITGYQQESISTRTSTALGGESGTNFRDDAAGSERIFADYVLNYGAGTQTWTACLAGAPRWSANCAVFYDALTTCPYDRTNFATGQSGTSMSMGAYPSLSSMTISHIARDSNDAGPNPTSGSMVSIPSGFQGNYNGNWNQCYWTHETSASVVHGYSWSNNKNWNGGTYNLPRAVGAHTQIIVAMFKNRFGWLVDDLLNGHIRTRQGLKHRIWDLWNPDLKPKLDAVSIAWINADGSIGHYHYKHPRPAPKPPTRHFVGAFGDFKYWENKDWRYVPLPT